MLERKARWRDTDTIKKPSEYNSLQQSPRLKGVCSPCSKIACRALTHQVQGVDVHFLISHKPSDELGHPMVCVAVPVMDSREAVQQRDTPARLSKRQQRGGRHSRIDALRPSAD